MKLNKILFGVLAAALMSACSSDDVTNGGKKPAGGGFNGDGYIAVKVNLPTTPSSAFKAANDNYDDGTTNEYKVDNAALLLFKGSSEPEATFLGIYDLNLMGNQATDPKDDNITTTYNKAVKVENVTLGENENLYGLVVVNYDDVMTIENNSCKINGENFTGTFKALLEKKTENELKRTNEHFFMANAPLSSVIGGSTTTAPKSSDVTTLVKLTGSLKDTEKEALAAPAGSVYVERAVAKATLNANNVIVGVKKGDNTMNVNTVMWALGNAEPESFIVRNLGDDASNYIGYKSDSRDSYRFVGSIPMKSGVSLYRTYWCIDPAYNTDKTYRDVNENDFITAGSTPLYCHENTFSINFQKYKSTTRAVLKVTFNGGTFYTVNGDLTTAYTEEAAKSYAIKMAAEDERIKNLLKENLKEGESIENYTTCVTTTFSKNDANVVTLSDLAINIPEELKTKFSNTNITLNEEVKSSIILSVNTAYKLVEYTDGVSYYDLRFKHFAGKDNNDESDLAPWTPKPATDPGTAYGNDAKNYLGRYGMVRNNWYDVNVTKINNIGSPVIPNADIDKSDDNQDDEKWIAFDINILSWAKRTQDYEF